MSFTPLPRILYWARILGGGKCDNSTGRRQAVREAWELFVRSETLTHAVVAVGAESHSGETNPISCPAVCGPRQAIAKPEWAQVEKTE